METFTLMGAGKAAGPSGVKAELLNVCKKESAAEVANN